MFNRINWNYVVVGCCGLVVALTAVVVLVVVPKNTPKRDDMIREFQRMQTVHLETPMLQSKYIMTEDEFEEYQEENTESVFESYTDYIESTFKESEVVVDESGAYNFASTFKQPKSSISVDASDANGKLYQYCNTCFNCFVGNNRVSPLFPMALANVETPGRADYKKTWSALFPSMFVSVDKIDTFNVRDVIKLMPSTLPLTKEYSTKYRGALQMSVTYGTSSTRMNATMSGTEAEKLAGIDAGGYSWWVSSASTAPGDRFYIPDVLKRLQVAMNGSINDMTRNGCIPDTDMGVIAALAIAHNSGSGVWWTSNPDSKIGNWYSQRKCLAWCNLCGSQELVSALEQYAKTSSSYYITRNTARGIFEQVYPGVSYRDYVTNDINAFYPVSCIYAQIKLNIGYSKN